ncbi:hypothetical protein ES708_13702 [subsurface metagenome]
MISLKGEVYAKSSAAASDAARRFETTKTVLVWAAIQVTVKDMLFGDSATQPVKYVVDEKFELYNVDVSTLYFRNADSSQHGTVSIVGIKATYN